MGSTPSKEELNAVKKARLILLEVSHLPVELIDFILDLAEFWTCISSQRQGQVEVFANFDNQNRPECCYLLSEPIRNPIQLRKIVISTVSHDQGWGGESKYRGTYHGSYTWFEAAILKQWFQQKYRPFIEKCQDHTPNIEDGADLPQVVAPEILRKDMGKRWHVQRNVQVSRSQREHTITWDVRCPPMDGDPTENKETGSGSGTNFLQSLEEGDKIAIIARALYPGWANHVYSVQVDVYYWIPEGI